MYACSGMTFACNIDLIHTEVDEWLPKLPYELTRSLSAPALLGPTMPCAILAAGPALVCGPLAGYLFVIAPCEVSTSEHSYAGQIKQLGDAERSKMVQVFFDTVNNQACAT